MWLILTMACSEEPPPPPLPKLETVAAPAGAPPIDEVVLESPPTYGQQCRDHADCPAGAHPGYCFCSEPLPEGGAEALGFCWNGAVKQGGAWWCTVQDGHAFRMGLIFP